jgi:hypothetical protein
MSVWNTNRITMAFAAFGALAFLALTTVALRAVGVINWDIRRVLSASDEAPIRVRNGSVDFVILSPKEPWEQIGTSGSWRIKNSSRHREDFEVTIAVRPGASCGGAVSATGSDIVVVYENDDNPATTSTARIVVQSAGRRTVVKPDTGVTMTWDAKDPQRLSYKVAGGFIQSIAVGNGANPATLCSFANAAQLEHLLILNVP